MMKQLKQFFTSIRALLVYVINARYRKGHGVHPPKAFEFISKVLYDRYFYPEYTKVEEVISRIRSDHTLLDYTEVGGRSRTMKERRSVSDMAKKAGVKKKYGRLLFRVVHYYRPKHIIELGTSVGISTLYLAQGNKGTKLITIEGNNSCIKQAKKYASLLGTHNIDFRNGLFDNLLEDALIQRPELVYVDGNHTYEATLRYYQQITSVMKSGFIVFDDIHWSEDMQLAWKEIKRNTVSTIDLYQFGIVLIGDQITPEHFVVRF